MKLADQLDYDFAKGNMFFGKIQGLSELNVTLISILYLHKEPVSIEELSKKTGYSLSAISTAMKTLELLRKVTKIKIPGDKKAYYEANRDVTGTMKEMFQSFSKSHEMQVKQYLPELRKKYGSSTNKEVKEKMDLLKQYESQLKQMGKIMDEMLKKLEAL
jgi:DNA-binding transcriptional regulator GbsR (MarR family)